MQVEEFDGQSAWSKGVPSVRAWAHRVSVIGCVGTSALESTDG